MKKRIICIVIVLVMAVSLTVPAFADSGLDNFKQTNTYKAGTFKDVSESAWYASGVKTAYELGLMVGTGNGFNPNGDVTIAETLAIACRLYSTYYNDGASFGGASPWYQKYVDYAINKGIIAPWDYSNYNAKATRSQFAAILAHALPDSVFEAVNDVTSIPDVSQTDKYAAEIFKLYKAGILSGSDDKGTFYPNTYITRSAVASITARMVKVDLRSVKQAAVTQNPKDTASSNEASEYIPAELTLWTSRDYFSINQISVKKEKSKYYFSISYDNDVSACFHIFPENYQGNEGTFTACGMAAEAGAGTVVLSSPQSNIENNPMGTSTFVVTVYRRDNLNQDNLRAMYSFVIPETIWKQ